MIYTTHSHYNCPNSAGKYYHDSRYNERCCYGTKNSVKLYHKIPDICLKGNSDGKYYSAPSVSEILGCCPESYTAEL